MNKKIIVSIMALVGAVVLAGCGKTTIEQPTPTESMTSQVESTPICDENGNVYASEQEAKDAGLTEAQYGATYCQYLDDDTDNVYDNAMGNATYTIEGEEITLSDGNFEQPSAPGSASMTTLKLEDDLVAMGDLNGDGIENDYAGVVLYNGGGSGTFAYVVALVNNKGTNGVVIGDRVPVDNITIDKGVITVKTYKRTDKQSMADKPSVAVMKTYVVTNNGVLTEQK